MFFKVKNCRIYAPEALNRHSLLFSYENGASRVVSELPAGASVTEIDGKGRLLFPAFTDIGCHFYDKNKESRDSLVTASAAASAGGYRRLVTLGGDGDGRTVAAKRANKSARDGIYYGYYGDGCLFETLSGISLSGGLYISCGMSPRANGCFASGIASKMTGTAGFSRYDECGGLSDLLFAAYETGCRVHIRSIGCRESLEMIKDAKKSGVKVTVGVSPFHLALTENDVPFYGAMCKLLPPLRSKSDRDALREGLMNGDIDCVSSCHTPLTASEKPTDCTSSPFGLCSLETALPVVLTYMPELIDYPERIAEAFALRPSALIGESFSLRIGESADFVLLDPASELVISKNTLKSKSVNTPFLGQTLIACGLRLYLNGKA